MALWKWTIFNGWKKVEDREENSDVEEREKERERKKVKELKISFSCNARIHGSRHRAGDRCHAVPWRQQSRTVQARGAQMSRLSAEDQQLYNRTSLTSRAHRGSLSKRRELVLSSLPPPPPFSADSRPLVSKVVCLISLYLLSTCMYHTFSHITFLGYNHMNSRASVFLDSLLSEHIIRYHMCPWGRLLPGYHTRFFLQRGCCCQGKEVVPVDHIRGKGLISRLTSGSKIRLTAGFEPRPQGPAPSSLAAAHSPF